MSKDYLHYSSAHTSDKYVNGRVHTNGLENFWALLKRGIEWNLCSSRTVPSFRAMLMNKLSRYNNRPGTKDKKLTDLDRFELALSQIAGKRLTFAEVTGKTH